MPLRRSGFGGYPVRALQPSMSRTGLLLECSFPFGQVVSTAASSDDAADYGSCFHELLAGIITNDWVLPSTSAIENVAKRWGLDETAAAELAPHLGEASVTLRRWLEGANPFRVNFLIKGARVLVEQAYALRNEPPKGIRHYWRARARLTSPPTQNGHVYEDLRPGELAGTADLVIVPPRRTRSIPLLVLDHKTSVVEEFYEPLKKPQLLSLARAVSLAHVTPPAGVAVGVLHARRRGLSAVYADVAPKELLEEHASQVFSKMSRIGDGTMRPGPWCVSERCPAREVCPARHGQLLEKSSGLLTGLIEFAQAGNPVALAPAPAPAAGLSREKKLGALYAVVQQAEKLAEASRKEIRNEVLAGALPELPGGGVLTIRKYPKENLSKASILRAYGKLEGERLLAKLRTQGAIESSEVVTLHVEREKGE